MYHLLQFWCWFCEELIVKLVLILAHMDHKGTTAPYLYSQKYKYWLLNYFPGTSSTGVITDIIVYFTIILYIVLSLLLQLWLSGSFAKLKIEIKLRTKKMSLTK